MNVKKTLHTLFFLLGTFSLFHMAIIVKLIPYQHVWGGRLETEAEMYQMEILSLIITLALIALLMIKGGYLTELLPIRVVNILLWIFVLFFALNTVGNLLATSMLEKAFSLLTLTFTYLIWLIVRKEKKTETRE